MLQSPIVFITDTRAINHVLMHCAEYPKPHSSRRELEKALGPGELFCLCIPFILHLHVLHMSEALVRFQYTLHARRHRVPKCSQTADHHVIPG